MKIEDYSIKIGLMLYKARLSIGKTGLQMSRILGTHVSNIYAWEGGNVMPPFRKCDLIAIAYGINPKEFCSIMEKAKKNREEEIELRKNLKKTIKHQPYIREIQPPFVFRG